MYIVSMASSACLSGRWGHTLVSDGGHVFIVGGLGGGTDNDFISLLRLPPQPNCSLAQTITECQDMPGCSVCTSNSTNDFVACYGVSDSNAPLRCSSLGGSLIRTCQSCDQFESCGACLSTDVALEMGCVWCSRNEQCVSPSSVNCSGPTVNSSTPDVCYLDRCAFPSCSDCRSPGCRWLSAQIRASPNVPNSIEVSTNIQEWGCYSDNIHRLIVNELIVDTSISSCYRPCSAATSCSTCVASPSPTGGPVTCVWAEYSQECMSSDLVPLACSRGECGPIVSSSEQCPKPCASRETCDSCLMYPRCAWLNNVANKTVRCVAGGDLLKSGILDHQSDDEIAIYFECPQCFSNCSGHGSCVNNHLVCECDVGYVGEHCEVECLCNGHSYCANGTEGGRRVCVECLHNTQVSCMLDISCMSMMVQEEVSTFFSLMKICHVLSLFSCSDMHSQGPACEECKPLFVGSPSNGSQCISCLQFCHGNSEVCIREEEYIQNQPANSVRIYVSIFRVSPAGVVVMRS